MLLLSHLHRSIGLIRLFTIACAAGQPGQAKVLSERMDDAGYDVDELLMRQLEWQLTQSQRASDRETVAA